MFYLAIVLLIIQFSLFVSAAKSSGKWANIRFGLGVLIAVVVIWMGLNSFNTPKELTNHPSTSESR